MSTEAIQIVPPARILDVLRAAAVLLVLLSHLLGNGFQLYAAGYVFPHSMGRLGVLLFFVHTSLVLLFSLERINREGLPLFRTFYVRRAFRIYPLSCFVVLLVSWLQIPDPFETFRELSRMELVANLGLFQNLTGARNATGPLWSLPWEVQMYGVLPVLYVALRGRPAMAVAGVSVVCMCINAAGVSVGIRAFRILDYFPCFLGGVFAWAAMVRGGRRYAGIGWLLLFASGVTGYIVAGLGWPIGTVFLPEWAVCSLCGWSLTLFADLPASVLTRSAGEIAKYSYGVYLFHMPAIWFAFDSPGGLGGVGSLLVALALTTVGSVCAFHLVEAPFIRFGKRLSVRGAA